MPFRNTIFVTRKKTVLPSPHFFPKRETHRYGLHSSVCVISLPQILPLSHETSGPAGTVDEHQSSELPSRYSTRLRMLQEVYAVSVHMFMQMKNTHCKHTENSIKLTLTQGKKKIPRLFSEHRQRLTPRF